MALYESVLIARQDVTAAQVETLTETVTALIKEQGGEVKKAEQWGLKSLTYKINKNRKGHYVLLNIEGPSSAINEYERTLSLNEDVLRFMTVRVEAHERVPPPCCKIRGERGEKSDRPGGMERGGERGERSGGRSQATGAVSAPVVIAPNAPHARRAVKRLKEKLYHELG